MKLTPKTEATVPYSPMEETLFRLLPKDGKRINSPDITKKYYDSKGLSVPYHGRNIVMAAMRGLRDKIEINNEDFALRFSPQRGPHPIDFWIEKP